LPVADLIAELKRRRVFRVLVGYGVVAFAVLQVVEPIQHALGLSDAVLKAVVVLLGLGFPVALVLGWAFDVHAGAIERTPPAAGARFPPGVTLAALAGAGVLIAVPGVAWFLLARRPAPAVPSGGDVTLAAPAAAPSAAAPGPAGPKPQPAPSIAVLPLVNLSSDKEQDYFSDGLAEELLNLLAQVPGLHVSARTSAFSFKGKNAKISEIAHELGVATVLEGSVRKSGSRLRITMQLINGADAFHLWSATYDRQLTEVFAVQDEIARAVVAALRLKLLPPQPEAGPRDPQAHDQYLLGLHFLKQGTGESARRAEEALERAVALDPGLARAWAALSEARFLLSVQAPSDHPPASFQPAALEAAEKAIAIAPGEAAGWAARGGFRMKASQDWSGARRDLEKAVALAPGNPEALAHYGLLLAATGQVTEGLAVAQRAVAADPLSAFDWYRLAIIQLGAGDFTGAEASARRAFLLSPDSSRSLRTVGYSLLLQHRLDEARATFARIEKNSLNRLMGEALLAQEQGNPAEALRLTEEVLRNERHAAYQVAQLFAWQGRSAQACEWLERAHEQRDTGLIQVLYDPLLRGVRADPCYAAAMRKLGLPVQGAGR
jgi:TolB-like protein/Tfp pilus assembly protein PilF